MTHRTVGIAIASMPPAAAYRLGSQGLLDYAINELAAGSLESHLTTLEPTQFENIVDTFAGKLENLGFQVKKLDRTIAVDSLPRLKTSSGAVGGVDYRSLREEGIEFLVLFSIEYWGTTREYYGFIPLEAPNGMCAAKGLLIELQTNTLAWQGTMDITDAKVEVSGPWDMPPDFPNVTRAINDAIMAAEKYLVNDFFETTVENAKAK